MRTFLVLTSIAAFAAFGTTKKSPEKHVKGNDAKGEKKGKENDGGIVIGAEVTFIGKNHIKDGQVCFDGTLDLTGNADEDGDGCSRYHPNHGCLKSEDWATDDFDAKLSCCICGGGHFVKVNQDDATDDTYYDDVYNNCVNNCDNNNFDVYFNCVNNCYYNCVNNCDDNNGRRLEAADKKALDPFGSALQTPA